MRRSGILLHPTSLPWSPGVGDLGPAATRWIEWLESTSCGLWQVLPLGPTGFADSPYQCFSAFAGNPHLVSPELLAQHGLLDPEDIDDAPPATGRADFGTVIPWKLGLLDHAFGRIDDMSAEVRERFAAFREREREWLDDFALFMALKDHHGGGSYTDWPEPIRTRHPEAMAAARARLEDEAARHAFHQFLFFEQWDGVLRTAHASGLAVIGDAPIFVAPDSADVWAHPRLFRVDDRGLPEYVAGVPPDYFSDTGQLWGNPLYDWDEHAQEGYGWWIRRMRKLLEMHDIVRIDHFRGFADYWEIPAESETAETGRWVLGPGRELFDALENALGELPIIAEDLGELHYVVPELLEATGLPGMRVAQFSLWPEDDHPRDWPEHSVGYTGTHDNQTTVGWYDYIPDEEKHQVRLSMQSDAEDVAWDLVRLVWESPARMVLAPIQDFLRLGDEARMNLPGTVGPHNWTWRLGPDDLTADLASEIAELNRATGRERDV